jgi:hypothetical protein
MKFNQKEWAKIVGYFVPILALVIANVFQISDVAEIQDRLTAIVTVIFSLIAGVIGLIGVIKSHDKKK